MDYNDLLHWMTKEWLLLEMKHRTSKSASNDFWALSSKVFPKLHRAKIEGMVFKPIPNIRYQREKMMKETVPDITLEIGYLNKTTEEVTVVKANKTPKSRFSPRTYMKLFEVATVQVKSPFKLSMITPALKVWQYTEIF